MELSRSLKIVGAIAVVAVVVLAFVWNMPIDDRPNILINYDTEYVENTDITVAHIKVVNDSDEVVYVHVNFFDLDGVSMWCPLAPESTKALRLEPFDSSTIITECNGDHTDGELTYDYPDKFNMEILYTPND